jgi:hypothetical protein
MRKYLTSFFAEFGYDGEDARTLLCAYDAITENEEARAIWNECLSSYEENEKMDFEKEILGGQTAAIAEKTGLPIYTVELLIFISMSRRLRDLYHERGLSDAIYRDSVLDLKWKLEECKLVKGVCGSFVAAWFGGFFDLTRFALGRLQFELVPFEHEYSREDIVLTPESTVINVHIPRTGTPMEKEACERSYRMAADFFEDRVGKIAPFVCHSWLLYPEHFKMLSPTSNIYRFISEYDIVKSGVNSGYDLWRLFDTDERDPDKLPADSSLRRSYIAYLKNGGKPGWGFGVKILRG